jgi:hypothetical protein
MKVTLFILLLCLPGCLRVPDTTEAEDIVNKIYEARAKKSGLAEIKFWPLDDVEKKKEYLKYIRERSNRSGKLIDSKLIKSGMKQVVDTPSGVVGQFIYLVYRAEYERAFMEEAFYLKASDGGKVLVHSSEVLSSRLKN